MDALVGQKMIADQICLILGVLREAALKLFIQHEMKILTKV